MISIRLRSLTFLIALLLPALGEAAAGRAAGRARSACAAGRSAASSRCRRRPRARSTSMKTLTRARPSVVFFSTFASTETPVVRERVVALDGRAERAGRGVALDRGEHHLALLAVLLVAPLAAARALDLAELALRGEVVVVDATSASALAASASAARHQGGDRDSCQLCAVDHVLAQRSRCTPLNTPDAQEDRARNFTPCQMRDSGGASASARLRQYRSRPCQSWSGGLA